jgi:cation:H+ antiporter
MLFFFVLFMLYIFRISRDDITNNTVEKNVELPALNKSVIFILIGMTGLYFGGNWVVDGAIKFAKLFGLSEAFIGLTIVAVGTSLPELVTSVVAAMKRSPDIAVGNAVGSNIFNLLWVLGLSAVIKPMPFDVINNLDVLLMVFSLVLIILTVIVTRKYQIRRMYGILFLLCYVAYIVFLVYRG